MLHAGESKTTFLLIVHQADSTTFPGLSDRVTLQFLAELFNVVNHVNYAAPPKASTFLFNQSGGSLASAGVLVVPTASTSRQSQFALKVIF